MILEKVFDMLDKQPSRMFTFKEIQEELCVNKGGLSKALNNITKYGGYKILIKESKSITKRGNLTTSFVKFFGKVWCNDFIT